MIPENKTPNRELFIRRWAVHFGPRRTPSSKLLRLWERSVGTISPDQLICACIEHRQYSLLDREDGEG